MPEMLQHLQTEKQRFHRLKDLFTIKSYTKVHQFQITEMKKDRKITSQGSLIMNITVQFISRQDTCTSKFSNGIMQC